MTEETAELTCQRCERSYVSEGDEEDRCPFCEASQHDCDICTEIGGETCISCGQWVCAGCWAGHADEDGAPCERGSPDWKEPSGTPPCEECEDHDAIRCPAENRPLCAGCNPHHTDSTGDPCERAHERP